MGSVQKKSTELFFNEGFQNIITSANYGIEYTIDDWLRLVAKLQ
jgi:hypothetical protein